MTTFYITFAADVAQGPYGFICSAYTVMLCIPFSLFLRCFFSRSLSFLFPSPRYMMFIGETLRWLRMFFLLYITFPPMRSNRISFQPWLCFYFRCERRVPISPLFNTMDLGVCMYPRWASLFFTSTFIYWCVFQSSLVLFSLVHSFSFSPHFIRMKLIKWNRLIFLLQVRWCRASRA